MLRVFGAEVRAAARGPNIDGPSREGQNWISASELKMSRAQSCRH